jgi:hypothetical protein
MLVALGANTTFRHLPTAGKVASVRALNEIRLRLTAFDEFKQQLDRQGKAAETLRLGGELIIKSMGETWGDNAIRLISGLQAHEGLTFERASARMCEYLETTRLLLAINDSAPTKPKLDLQIRSLKQDAETKMLRDLLDTLGVDLVESGNDAYGHDKGLVLMGLMARWTSGKAIRPDTMRKRLSALRKRGLAENFPTS